MNDENELNELNPPVMDGYTKIPTFKLWVANRFPYMETDFDGITNYELLEALTNYLNNVIKNEENVESNVAKLNQAYLELLTYVKEYFNNLDVQEEINNKLDEMVEDGTLQEIISSYLNANALWCFNNIEDMKNATNLINGSYAKTLGYYEVNDGGGSLYYIRNKTNNDIEDNASIIFINNELVAELQILNDTINVKQFGAKGNGITDDTIAIQNAFSIGKDKYIKINFNNETYIINGKIPLYSNTDIELNNAIIKTTSFLAFINNDASVQIGGYGSLKNITFNNGEFNGTNENLFKQIAFRLMRIDNLKFTNIRFINCSNESSHILDMGGCSNVLIENCYISGSNNESDDTKYREMIQLDYSSSDALPYWTNPNTVYDDLPCKDIIINNCKFEKGNGNTYFNSIGSHAVYGKLALKNITISNCQFDNCWSYTIKIPRVNNLKIKNNIFNDTYTTPTALNKNLIYLLSLVGEEDPEITENVEISDNICYQTSDLRINSFINISGLSTNYSKLIKVFNNKFYGSWESGNNGAKFITLGYTEQIEIYNNNINNNRIFIQQDGVFNKLNVHNNIFNVFNIIRNKANTSIADPLLTTFKNNIFNTSNNSISDTGSYAIFGVSEDIITTENQRVPIDTRSRGNELFTAYGNGRINHPGYIKELTISGSIIYTNNSASDKLYKFTLVNYNDNTERVLIEIDTTIKAGETKEIIIPNIPYNDSKFNQLNQNTNWIYTNSKVGDKISTLTQLIIKSGI